MLIVVIVLVVLVERREREAEQQSLINGVLWANQNLRTQIASHVELLTTLGNEFAVRDYTDTAFQFRSRSALRNSPGLIGVTWFWGDGRVQNDYAFVARDGRAAYLRSETVRDLIARANRAGQATFGAPYARTEGDASIDVVIPIAAGSDLQGYIGGTLSMRAILQEWVPGWYAQRYQLEIMDAAGVLLASTAKVAGSDLGMAHETDVDLPGQRVRLKATRFGSDRNWIPLLLVGTVALLGVAILWSIFSLRRHVRDRLLAERELAREARFRKAMENSIVTGMRARDREGRIIYVNRAFCEMTGFSAEELLGTQPPHPYWAPEVTEESQAFFARVVAGEAPADGFELLMRRRSGERFTVLIHEAPLIDAAGNHVGWMGSVIDITQRKRTEEMARQQQEQLQHASRLITMGEMASTLAHELNQPLAVINSYATGSLNRLTGSAPVDPQELRLAIERIAEQAHRAGKIIQWVHEFVKRRQPEMQTLAMGDVVDRAVSMMEPAARRQGVTLTVHAPPAPLPPVVGDRVMLEQVLVNLIRNAMDAMLAAPTREVTVTLAADSEAAHAEVVVEDTGAGVPPAHREQLFQPFFSSKAKGMGMGLNASRAIMEAHRGVILYEPAREGPGSIFRFKVPLAHES
jgi:two-component system, LuxR family, sensor histidine kinase DctS